jgi:hypothetical protein
VQIDEAFPRCVLSLARWQSLPRASASDKEPSDSPTCCADAPVAKEACAYVLSHYPDVPLTVDEYFEERTRIQNELWKKVPLMAGAAHLVKSLVRF